MSRKTTPIKLAPFIKGPVPSVQAVQKKSLCRVGEMKARLQRKEKVVGVKENWRWTSFSKSLLGTGRMEMGLKLDGFARSPPLWSGRMEAHFHWEGNCEEVMEELMMDDSG